MDIIRIKGTSDTPNIILDAEKNIIEFSGKSLPSNVKAFYAPIMKWIEEYIKNPNSTTNVVFKLDYFNTASAKAFLDVLIKFKDSLNEGHNVVIHWYHREDDSDMLEAGKEFSKIIDIPFKIQTQNY